MVTAAERGREVRQRLLQAAIGLIAEKGWTAVTTRMLAERAGVGSGVVHYHFSSMQALLVEAAVGAARQLGVQMSQMLAGAGSADEVLSTLFGMLDTYTGTDPMSVLFVEAYLAGTRDDELRRALGEVIGDARRQLAERLDADGVPDAEATAAVLGAALDGVLLHRALLPSPTGEQMTAVLRRLLPPRSEEPR